MPGYNASPTAERTFDWITFSIYLSLIVVGILMLFSTEQASLSDMWSFKTVIGKQVIWAFISLAAFVVAVTINWRNWDTLSYPIYIIGMILLIGVLIFGTSIKGSTAWYSFAGVSFQPSEFAKLATAVALASFLSNYSSDLRNRKTVLIAFGLISLPILLILAQPDFGSAMVFLSFFILFFRLGLTPAIYVAGIMMALVFIFSIMYEPWLVLVGLLLMGVTILLSRKLANIKFIGSIVGLVALAIAGWYFGLLKEVSVVLGLLLIGICFWINNIVNRQLIFAGVPTLMFLILFAFGSSFTFNKVLMPHQQERINVWLRPDLTDPQGARYNIIQSQLAIGSGGIQGKGFMNGNFTKFNYVPEQNTDFIFSTVGEEQGFIGSLSVICLYVLLLLRITNIAERSKFKFITNYGYGLAGILFIHFFINIGMTMGIMPVVGIPLPFLSKGGSSLLVFSIMMGILLRMDLARHKRI